jgi:hypothetical protein
MVAKLPLDPEKLWEAYQRNGSLRGASRELGVGHMLIKAHLQRAGYSVEKKETGQSMHPKFKVYIRPEQFEALDDLAQQKGVENRHEMARQLLDKALKDELGDWQPTV